MSVIDDLLNLKEPEYRTAEFCTRHDLRERWAEAKQKVNAARLQAQGRNKDAGAAAELEAAEQDLDDLRAEIGQHLITFQFRSVERTEFDAIKAKCRPTESQRTEARKLGQQPPEWNIDTFSPALVAAACTKLTGPSGEQEGLSLEEAEALWASDRWNHAERTELFHTALSAYIARTDLDGVALGKGSARIDV